MMLRWLWRGLLALIALALQRARNMGRRRLLFTLGMIGAALFIGALNVTIPHLF